ncbi:MAG TPA: UDP-glucose/GDP-mannose dehydrogenase family protein [Bacteroidales bacterium]|nr:UDP-glucose/GDP-mannose dehydrogenase family protein [Bacteroidales bacterium]HPI69392.1 UDP-glucose/GDP-mannose dehydrogenase family protein [Bacteroidales bacterium]HPR72833.1 UDP-glucose/GDP-mannose dehydrogenase family protein [Bacteroidales bacterium]
MKIAVVGTGYVGLVTGTCFAETGVSVTCIDKDIKKVTQLSKGSIPIYEPGLENLMRTNIGKKRLFFTSDVAEGIKDSEVVFIAVGTPAGEDGSADLQHVINAAKDIGRAMTSHMVIVTKSTVPVGTSEKVRKAIHEELDKRKVKIDFDIASNPEFLKEGAAVEDFLRPERIVIGVDNEKTKDIMNRLYYSFVLNNHPIYFMNIASAEITKYAANAMLATRISFINEIANLCDILGADINEVRKGIGSDSRIGNKFLYPGTGYGGSCFPKDVKAIIKTADAHGYELNVIKAVEKANEYQKNVIFRKMMQFFKNDLRGSIFAIWGLSFKPKTDDIRESASIYLIERLLKEGAEIRVYDPAAIKETKKKIGNSIFYASDPYEAVQGVNALILMTEWPEFRLPDFYMMAQKMKEKIIFDGRNIYDPGMLKKMGFIYFGIGRRQAF